LPNICKPRTDYLGVWRIQRIANQPVGLVDVRGQQLEHRISDNRLFGVTVEIAWTPKPAHQLTVRTPLYAVRH
jgi:hypothetical protein